MCSEGCPRLHLMICYPSKLRRDAMEFFKKVSTGFAIHCFHVVMICFTDLLLSLACQQRFKFHSEVYKHKTVVAGAFMVIDILAKADPYFRIPTLMESEQGVKSVKVKELPISRAMENPTSYLRLKDSVLDQIMATTSPELREARLLIEKYQKRDLYSMAFKKQINFLNEQKHAFGKCQRKKLQTRFCESGESIPTSLAVSYSSTEKISLSRK